MASIFRLLPTLLFALCAAVTASLAHADPADIAAASRSVVRVVLIGQEDGGPMLVGHGSGFAVAPDVILTNAHVVELVQQEDDIRIGIVPPQGKGGWFGRVLAFAPKADLALIKLTERGALPPATLFTGPVGDGADVVAVGYPGNVDVAQGLNVGDIVSPTSPVKTRGNVSSGRSSKSFETILHTAPIGAGNSGGPLLDPCGRVIGANSFGTLSSDGDSEFYFAVADSEILRFLRASGISPRITAAPCRSFADVERAEAERLAGERVHSEEAARAIAEKKQDAAEKAERAALFQVLAERENRMALAMLALVLALGAAGGAYVFSDKERRREAKIAGGAAGVFLLAAAIAWLLRPGFSDVDSRAREWASGAATAPKSPRADKDEAGALACILDPARSRLTVSNPADLQLAWSEGGCADGKTQFGLDAAGWSRLTLSDADDSATVTTFDPATGAYRADRYFLDLETAAKLRDAQEKQPPVSCGGGGEAARKLGVAQDALKALLPAKPHERMAYSCK
jgi:hypothetical protein